MSVFHGVLSFFLWFLCVTVVATSGSNKHPGSGRVKGKSGEEGKIVGASFFLLNGGWLGDGIGAMGGTPRPKPLHLFCAAIRPTPDEVAAMVIDIKRVCVTWLRTAHYLGINGDTLRSWVSGRVTPTDGGARAVWLTWILICRPGAIQTTGDLCTSGRFTKRGNPATAGDRLKMPSKEEILPDDIIPQDGDLSAR